MNKQHNMTLAIAFLIGILISAIYNPLIAVAWLLITEIVISYREKKPVKHVEVRHGK